MNQVKDNFRLMPIEALTKYDFFVDDYQRGYKWTVQQVLDLLDDIYTFDLNEGIYCLQPVVTRLRDNLKERHEYELIDGQQRMTTIYMILAALGDSDNLYSIAYMTRGESSSKFLEKIKSGDINKLDINIPEIIEEKLTVIINSGWSKYIEGIDEKHLDNVDNYHFYMAYQVICLWLFTKSDEEKRIFSAKLLKHTNVIWYEVNSTENSKAVFMKINSGKIALTNAELIKALFLIDCKRSESSTEAIIYKQNIIAQEWDRIELGLQDEDFWSFINKSTERYNTATRIDFLFDILTDKKEDEKSEFFSYRAYNSGKKKLEWSGVKDLFDRMQEWYEERELYHLIGFIIIRGLKTIKDIIKLSRVNGKIEFKKLLVNIIVEKFKEPKYSLNELRYDENRKEVETILLLFNVESYQINDTSYRFPFSKLIAHKWSIEHIHAQNAELFTTPFEVRAWAEDSRVLVDDFDKAGEDIGTLKGDLEGLLKKLTRDSEKIEQDDRAIIVDVYNKLKGFLQSDWLWNLALLDGRTNSSIGNDTFLEKRKHIVEMDQKRWGDDKRFIPIGTKHAFMKYYTQDIKKVQMTYWGYNDRLDYITAIKDVLKAYLPKDESGESLELS